jgi:hypothetical protein
LTGTWLGEATGGTGLFRPWGGVVPTPRHPPKPLLYFFKRYSPLGSPPPESGRAGRYARGAAALGLLHQVENPFYTGEGIPLGKVTGLPV